MRIFRMIMECLTPLHCGGGEEDPLQDQPVSRDAFGLWRIPGSSLAGALRSLSRQIDPVMTARIFGEQEQGSGAPRPSLIWVEDAILLDFDGQAALAKRLAGESVSLPLGPFIRDHVSIDLETGAAIKGGKFDLEIVPAGARFLVSLRCDGWSKRLTAEEEAHFDALCGLIAAGALEFGGKTTNGYGRYHALASQYRDLNLENPEDMAIWLNLAPFTLLEPGEGRELPLPAEVEKPATDGLNGRLDLDLVCAGPILIGGGNPALGREKASEADLVFALSPWLDYENGRLAWRPVLPGSSLKGVLRHAVSGILLDRGLDKDSARKRLDGLFGHIENETSQEGQCGKVIIEDCPLSAAARPQFAQHAAIDRFTGGARDGALFSEEPWGLPGLALPLRMQVRNADAAEAGLIFQALLDLGQGLLSVGGGANRGNGRVQAKSGATAQAVLEALNGNLAWNSTPLLQGDGATRLGNLQVLAAQWDAAMEAWA